MKCAGVWKYALWVAAFGSSSLSHAVSLPQDWAILPGPDETVEQGLPAALQSPELAKSGQRLAEVEMLVALPYAQVLPVVVSALAAVGPLEEQTGVSPLSELDEGWGDVLFARRPDLVHQLVSKTDLPRLQQDVRDGALAEAEIPGRLASIERTLRFQPGSARTAALTEPYRYWYGNAERTYGATGGSSSRVIVRVMQLDAVMGHPATAVYLTRKDEFANPKASFTHQVRELANLNIFSPGQPKRLHRSSVPEAVFSPVYTALNTLPGANLQLGLDAGQWQPPAAPRRLVTEPKLTLPDPQARTLQAQALLITKNPDAMLVLADGSALLVRSYPRALLHWAPDDGQEPRVIWTPNDTVIQWHMARDERGQSAYMVADGQVLHFDAATRRLARHPIVFDKPELLKNVDYFPDGKGVPLAYRHDVRNRRDTLSIWQPGAQPAADGAPWQYALRLASLRQDVMRHSMRTNTQIKPVRWDGVQANQWIEDSDGLAELDSRTGRVLRAVRLPRRFGEVDPSDDTGMAQWTPPPFGSVKGGWIAVGFVLMDGKRRNPGLHVVDVASGKVRYSLTLPDQDSLKTAAGSPNGRLLALGTGANNKAIVVWNLENGRSLTLQADASGCKDLAQLQWSPSGERLWGRCSNGLLAWDIPATW